MSDYDRGAYAPPSDAPLAFDARDTRERRPAPVSLIVGIIVLLVLAGALALLYRGGVRERGDGAPPVVGEPVGSVRTAPEATAPAADPALQLDVYDDRDAAATETVGPEPTFAPEPEQPVVRPVAPAPAAAIPAPAPAPFPGVAAPTPAPTPAPARTPPVAAAPTRPAPARPTAAAPVARPAPTATPTIEAAIAAAPAAAPRPAASSGPVSVQIGAFSSTDLATRELARTRGLVPGGGGTRVDPVESNGATLYRGLVTGFPSREAARAYCDRLQASARSCLVR